MSFWFVVVLTLTVQEGISTIAVLLHARQLGYSLWIINAIWLAATILQITIGYQLGKFVQKSFADSKFEHWVKIRTQKLEATIDTKGEKLGLFLLSLVVSPFISAFLASWLDISFPSIFLFAFLGDAVWYASEWATVYGLQTVFLQAKEVIIFAAVFLVLLFFLIRYLRKKINIF